MLKPPFTDIRVCKIIEKHPEHKTKISQLERETRSLENKAQEEETHLKGFTAAHERAKSSFFFMRPRLKAQNQVKYANRSWLDRDLMILQRALKKVPDWCEDKDWKLPMIIQYSPKIMHAQELLFASARRSSSCACLRVA